MHPRAAPLQQPTLGAAHRRLHDALQHLARAGARPAQRLHELDASRDEEALPPLTEHAHAPRRLHQLVLGHLQPARQHAARARAQAQVRAAAARLVKDGEAIALLDGRARQGLHALVPVRHRPACAKRVEVHHAPVARREAAALQQMPRHGGVGHPRQERPGVDDRIHVLRQREADGGLPLWLSRGGRREGVERGPRAAQEEAQHAAVGPRELRHAAGARGTHIERGRPVSAEVALLHLQRQQVVQVARTREADGRAQGAALREVPRRREHLSRELRRFVREYERSDVEKYQLHVERERAAEKVALDGIGQVNLTRHVDRVALLGSEALSAERKNRSVARLLLAAAEREERLERERQLVARQAVGEVRQQREHDGAVRVREL
mmetsp:Transcript_11369/g.37338  ORF Transcript_11369/g.37338 Transcript_11369/m.37338 type:complete len:382 (-) Transcript_11369:444-1589(-)